MITSQSITIPGGILTTDKTTVGIDVAQYDDWCIQAIFTYILLEDSAGTFKLQGSNDNIHYDDIENASQAFTAATTSLGFSDSVLAAKYLRAVFTNSSGTGGSASCIFHGRIKS